MNNLNNLNRKKITVALSILLVLVAAVTHIGLAAGPPSAVC